jgi:hypothetical protein
MRAQLEEKIAYAESPPSISAILIIGKSYTVARTNVLQIGCIVNIGV